MAREKLDHGGNEEPKTSPREPVGLYKPTARECAVLLLRLHRGEGEGEQNSRLRIAEVSLQRLWGRRRILPEFVEDVAEWLS